MNLPTDPEPVSLEVSSKKFDVERVDAGGRTAYLHREVMPPETLNSPMTFRALLNDGIHTLYYGIGRVGNGILDQTSQLASAGDEPLRDGQYYFRLLAIEGPGQQFIPASSEEHRDMVMEAMPVLILPRDDVTDSLFGDPLIEAAHSEEFINALRRIIWGKTRPAHKLLTTSEEDEATVDEALSPESVESMKMVVDILRICRTDAMDFNLYEAFKVSKGDQLIHNQEMGLNFSFLISLLYKLSQGQQREEAFLETCDEIGYLPLLAQQQLREANFLESEVLDFEHSDEYEEPPLEEQALMLKAGILHDLLDAFISQLDFVNVLIEDQPQLKNSHILLTGLVQTVLEAMYLYGTGNNIRSQLEAIHDLQIQVMFEIPEIFKETQAEFTDSFQTTIDFFAHDLEGAHENNGWFRICNYLLNVDASYEKGVLQLMRC